MIVWWVQCVCLCVVCMLVCGGGVYAFVWCLRLCGMYDFCDVCSVYGCVCGGCGVYDCA